MQQARCSRPGDQTDPCARQASGCGAGREANRQGQRCHCGRASGGGDGGGASLQTAAPGAPRESALWLCQMLTLRQGDKFGGRKASREVAGKEDVGLSHLEAQKREETSRRQRRWRCELSPEP